MTCAGRNFQTDLGAAQSKIHRVVVKIGRRLPQRFFGSSLGFLRALHINVLRALGRVRKDRHLVGQHFGEAPRDRKIMRGPAVAVADFANHQLGDERRVAGQDAEVTALPRYLHLVSVVAYQQLVRRHDL